MAQEGRITRDTFIQIGRKFGISFTDEIVSIYLDGARHSNDFTRTILSLSQTDALPEFVVQISSLFAIAIVEACNALSESERTELRHQLQVRDALNYNDHPGEIEYLLVEGPGSYDFQTDTFQIPLIQQVYGSLHQDHAHIKVGLLCWVHCGGWGHIIIRGKNTGYDGGGMHGSYLEVEHAGKRYPYASNYYEHNERQHTA